jgi:hypothetical protein
LMQSTTKVRHTSVTSSPGVLTQRGGESGPAEAPGH